MLPTTATVSFTYQVPAVCNDNLLSEASFFCIFPPLSFTPGPTAVCLLRLLKYCKYCRVAPVVVAVEESILWNNHPDRKGLAGVRKGLAYLIIVTDAADAVSVNFSGRCKFLQI